MVWAIGWYGVPVRSVCVDMCVDMCIDMSTYMRRLVQCVGPIFVRRINKPPPCDTHCSLASASTSSSRSMVYGHGLVALWPYGRVGGWAGGRVGGRPVPYDLQPVALWPCGPWPCGPVALKHAGWWPHGPVALWVGDLCPMTCGLCVAHGPWPHDLSRVVWLWPHGWVTCAL